MLRGGRDLFTILVHLDFVVALFSGAFLTSDCISRERREGTLGFLFLTDLNGFDVVAGKFAALSLIPFHGLLATVPVVGLTVFMGGVTGGEFWRVLLVLMNTLFLSLSVGLWISTLVADERQAVGITLAALLVLTVLPEGIAVLLSFVPIAKTWEWIRLAGPWGVLTTSLATGYRTGSRAFLWGLANEHALAWLFLGVAAAVVRRTWQERDDRSAMTPATGRGREPVARLSTARRVRLIREGPLAWMASRSAWARRAAWWVAVLAVGVSGLLFGGLIWDGQRFTAGAVATLPLVAGFYALKLLAAIHAIYSLQEACRSGAMELLLVTPVTSRRLCDGHLAGMRDAFVWPLVVLSTVEVGVGLFGTIVKGGDWPSRGTMILSGTLPAALAVGVHWMDFIAVTYHASRWALHFARPGRALFHTVGLVLILPALFCSYGRVLIDVYVISRSRSVLERFREAARGWYFPGPLTNAFGAPRGF